MKLTRKNIVIIILNILFFYVVANMLFSAVSVHYDIQGLKKKKKFEEKRISELKKIKEQKEKELHELSDEEMIEKIARDRLYMKKDGEVIYRLMDENN